LRESKFGIRGYAPAALLPSIRGGARSALLDGPEGSEGEEEDRGADQQRHEGGVLLRRQM